MDQSTRAVPEIAPGKCQEGRENTGNRSYYAKISRTRSMTDPEEERILVRMWQRLGDARARDLVVQSHLRFVVRQAHRKTKDRAALQDYIAAGNLGLLRAIEPGHFNPDRQPYVRFLTYAGAWVYKEMMDQDYASSSIIHVTTHVQKEQRRRARAHRVAETTFGPESQEAKDTEYVCYTDRVLSLDEIHDDQLSTDVGVADDYHAKQRTSLLEGALSRLPQREAMILRLHFGVKDEARSLEQIGKIMSMTPERVRQIKVVALRLARRYLETDASFGTSETPLATRPGPPRRTAPELAREP
jgi:RNA polymerase primary sigma factor